MGLDIRFSCKNEDSYFDEAKSQNIDLSEYGLSRAFCHLLLQDNIENQKSDLSIIGKVVNIDIFPLIKMTWYCDELDMEGQFILYDNEEEKQQFIARVKKINSEVLGNIGIVSKTIDSLILSLSKKENLLQELRAVDAKKDSIINSKYGQYYFSDFNKNDIESFTYNNLGQDLRNVKWKVDFAKSIGEKTIFFRFE